MDTIAEITYIWLSTWFVRHKYDLDQHLDRVGQVLRWVVVGGGFALTGIPGLGRGSLRVAGLWIGLAFLCWPNLAYYLANAFRFHSRYKTRGPM